MAKADQKSTKTKKGFFRSIMSTFFDVPRWVNAKQYAETNRTLYEKMRGTFRIAQAQRKETFEEAMQRLNVTEQDLQTRLANNQRILMMMLVVIGFLTLYGVYLLFHGAMAGALMVLAVIVLSAVRAFQYSFWNFQIENRKLGCSFQEWWRRNKS